MFERFTDGSRRAVVLAQEESRELGHRHIGPEHLLIGVAVVPEGTAAKALADVGATVPALRRALTADQPTGSTAPAGHIPFTPAAKRAMELSLREAVRRDASMIDTGHVLLALLGAPDEGLRRMLGAAGVDTVALAAATDRRLAEAPPGEPADGAPTRAEAMLAEIIERLERIERRLDGLENVVGR